MLRVSKKIIGFVQSLLPHTDLGYSWIDASVVEPVIGYATSSEDIRFLSSSDVGSAYRLGIPPLNRYFGSLNDLINDGNYIDFISDNFNWMNYHIYEPITSSDNLLGFPLNIDWSNILNGAWNNNILYSITNNQAWFFI